MTTDYVNVAFCNDERYESGLHVALLSLLGTYEDSRRTLRIFFFFDGFGPDRIAKLRETLASIGKPYELIARECSTSLFKGFPRLHGNRLTYVRLLVPELAEGNRIIFLDSDVIVNTNVATLFDMELKGKCLGVVASGQVKHANDQGLLKSLGMTPETPYFNAAVLVIDSERWRKQRYTTQCLDFLQAHRDAKITVDQTALNYVLRNDYAGLPNRFNITVYPSDHAISIRGREGIFHFCGSPKPWDAFGKKLHGNYKLFEQFLARTALRAMSSKQKFMPSYLLRTALLARSYWMNIAMRFRKHH
jgi:lipopolysaccharide biosynthesis glycosyltransferase